MSFWVSKGIKGIMNLKIFAYSCFQINFYNINLLQCLWIFNFSMKNNKAYFEEIQMNYQVIANLSWGTVWARWLINNRKYFFKVLEIESSRSTYWQIRCLMGIISWFKYDTFLWCSHIGEGSRWFFAATLERMESMSQWSYLLISS